MPRGKRAESNGLDAAKAKAAADAARADAAEAQTEDSVADDEEAGLGHNGPAELTEEQRMALTFMHKKAYEKALDAKKLADAALKNVAKLAKAELGADAVADIKHIIELETEEGEEKFRAKVEREVRIARWMGLPVGMNGNLFDEVDRTPAVDRAAANGKRAGLAGETCSPPFDPSTPQFTAWTTGWQAGQTVLFNIKPMSPAAQDESHEFDDMPPADEPPAPRATAT